MKTRFLIGLTLAFFALLAPGASATQADDTTITIDGQTAGPTPIIVQLTLTASDTSVIDRIQFVITPQPGSVTRAFSATYSQSYMVSHGYIPGSVGEIFLPVYGLYPSYGNNVSLTYYFLDGSPKGDSTTVTTAAVSDPCALGNPTVVQART